MAVMSSGHNCRFVSVLESYKSPQQLCYEMTIRQQLCFSLTEAQQRSIFDTGLHLHVVEQAQLQKIDFPK